MTHTTNTPAPADTAALIVRDVCELDPANVDRNDVVSIAVSDLLLICERHTAPVGAVPPGSVLADSYDDLVDAICKRHEWESDGELAAEFAEFAYDLRPDSQIGKWIATPRPSDSPDYVKGVFQSLKETVGRAPFNADDDRQAALNQVHELGVSALKAAYKWAALQPPAAAPPAAPQEAPSDEEIQRLWIAHKPKSGAMGFARALLAHHGAQPAASVEPVMRIYAEGNQRTVTEWLDGARDLQDGDHTLYAAPVAAQPQAEPLHITHGPLMRYAAALLRLREPVTPDFEEAAANLERAADGHPTPSGEPSPQWLEVAELAETDHFRDATKMVPAQQAVSGADGLRAEVSRLQKMFEAADNGMHAEAVRGDRLASALRGMLQLGEENHQRYGGDEDVCKEVREARAALAEHGRWQPSGNAPEHPDDAAVARFAESMKRKLESARRKGRHGWDDPDVCSLPYLSDLLRQCVVKGDPVDVANLAMMIHQRDGTILPPSGNAGELPPLPRHMDSCSSAEFDRRVREWGQQCFDAGRAALATQPSGGAA